MRGIGWTIRLRASTSSTGRSSLAIRYPAMSLRSSLASTMTSRPSRTTGRMGSSTLAPTAQARAPHARDRPHHEGSEHRGVLGLDDGQPVEAFTIEGDGDYVDQGINTPIGSYTIGSKVVGGGGEATAHPFDVTFPIHTDIFQNISARFQAWASATRPSTATAIATSATRAAGACR